MNAKGKKIYLLLVYHVHSIVAQGVIYLAHTNYAAQHFPTHSNVIAAIKGSLLFQSIAKTITLQATNLKIIIKYITYQRNTFTACAFQDGRGKAFKFFWKKY